MISQRPHRLTVLLGLVLLGACSNLPNPSSLLGPAPLTPQAGDPCASERAAFANSQSYFTADIVSGAMMGGMKSMFTGAVSRLGSGSSGSMTIGLAQDAFSGARAGYLSAIASHSGNEQEMLQQMSSDLHRENEQVDAVHGSFERLQSCRFQQARLIKTRARSGQLTTAQAREELGMERRLFEEELAAARKSGSDMKSRDQQFQYASEEVNRPGAAPAASGQTKHAVAVASASLPHKRDAYVTAVSDAEVRSKDALGDGRFDAATARRQPTARGHRRFKRWRGRSSALPVSSKLLRHAGCPESPV
jgi:hypothetical protein